MGVSLTTTLLTCLGVILENAAPSLNLISRSAVDCWQEAVNFYSTVQLLYTVSASTSLWKLLNGGIGNESVLKSLSDTRWEAHTMVIAAIWEIFDTFLEVLDYSLRAVSNGRY